MGSSKKFLNAFELRIAILLGLTNLLILKLKKKSSKKLMQRVHKNNGLKISFQFGRNSGFELLPGQNYFFRSSFAVRTHCNFLLGFNWNFWYESICQALFYGNMRRVKIDFTCLIYVPALQRVKTLAIMALYHFFNQKLHS